MATAVVDHLEEILSSQAQFDLSAPLTKEELMTAGLLTALPSVSSKAIVVPSIQNLDDAEVGDPLDVVAAVEEASDYNLRYAHYLRCQAIAALVGFDEGWKSFEELILKAYLDMRKRENKEYKGDDPNKAFSLRIREQTAEDFVKFIHGMVVEAVNVPKPVLEAKK